MNNSVDAVVKNYPNASIDQDNVSLFEGFLAHELRLPKCADCGLWHQPSRSVCPHCWSSNLVPTAVSGRGHVYLKVLLRQGPEMEGIKYPLPVIAVELEEQEALRYSGMIVDVEPDEIKIGMPVELIWVERNGAPYPAFKASSSTGTVRK